MKNNSGIYYKKCAECGKKKNGKKNFKRKHGTKFFEAICAECQAAKSKKPHRCLWCGKALVVDNSTYCNNHCSYDCKRKLALTLESEPDDTEICDYCKDEYPYYAVLGNNITCSPTSGSKCAKRLAAAKGSKTEKLKSLKPEPCNHFPQCVNFLTCLIEDFSKRKEGCYLRPPESKPIIHTGLLHCMRL